MSNASKKAPTVPFEKLEAVAKSASEGAASRGVTGVVAVAAKRTVQWRLAFNSAKRKETSKSADGSFSVSKNVVAKLFAKTGVSYDEVMTEAYAANGLDYSGQTVTPAPEVQKAPKAPKASKKAKVEATQGEVDALVEGVLSVAPAEA